MNGKNAFGVGLLNTWPFGGLGSPFGLGQQEQAQREIGIRGQRFFTPTKPCAKCAAKEQKNIDDHWQRIYIANRVERLMARVPDAQLRAQLREDIKYLRK